MGNDIKLPVSQKKEVEDQQEWAKAKSQLSRYFEKIEFFNRMSVDEIERLGDDMTHFQSELVKVENDEKQAQKNIEYYKKLIMEYTIAINEIKLEQIDANLSYDHYVQTAEKYLGSLEEIQIEEQILSNRDFSLKAVENLQHTIACLSYVVSENEKVIQEKSQTLLI